MTVRSNDPRWLACHSLRGNGKFVALYFLAVPLPILFLLPEGGFADYLRVLALTLPVITAWMASERVWLYRTIWRLTPESERAGRVAPVVVWLQPLAKLLLTFPAIALVVTHFGEAVHWYALPALVLAELLAASSEWIILGSLREQAARLEGR